MKTELIKISKLKNNNGQIPGVHKNPRIQNDAEFELLKKSLLEFPEMREIRELVVYQHDGDYIVVGGNMRLKALKEIGEKEVLCKVLPDNFPHEKITEFVIKDNAHFGQWDFAALADWAEPVRDWGVDVPDWDSATGLTATDDNYEIPEEIKTDVVLGDLITFEKNGKELHRLMCGDSTDSDSVAKLMNGEKADMVFTDPPYNINYQGVNKKMDKITNDKMSDSDFVQFLYDALNINSDTFYVCCSWQYSHLFREALDKLQKPVKSFIVWNKVNPAQHLDKYFKQHEILLYHGKFGGQKTLRGDIWEVKREQNTVHPTMKPISLISIALSDNADKKNIYDAFLGSGSTMVAAHQLKRKCYGMELDPKYCQVIIDRMLKLDPTIEIKKNGEPYKLKEDA